MTSEIIVVDPAAEDDVQKAALAPRLNTLQGARVGFIDNSKHMAEEMLREIEALLKSRYGVSAFSHFRKLNASVPTLPEVLKDLTTSCNAFVHGVAD